MPLPLEVVEELHRHNIIPQFRSVSKPLACQFGLEISQQLNHKMLDASHSGPSWESGKYNA